MGDLIRYLAKWEQRGKEGLTNTLKMPAKNRFAGPFSCPQKAVERDFLDVGTQD